MLALNAAVLTTGQRMNEAEAEMQLAGEAGLSIQELERQCCGIGQAALQIATSTGQQLAGMEQIAQAMQNILEVTAQGLASTQQTERVAAEGQTSWEGVAALDRVP